MKFVKSDLKNSEGSLGRFHLGIFAWIFMNPAQKNPNPLPQFFLTIIFWVRFGRRFGFGILILPFNRNSLSDDVED